MTAGARAASSPYRRGPAGTARAALTVIDRRCGEALSVQSVATEVGLSTRTLQRALARVGTDFSTSLHHARSKRAARLLAKGGAVRDVAQACGYRSCSHFSTVVFPSWYGVSPRAFQRAVAQFRSAREVDTPVDRLPLDAPMLIAKLFTDLEVGGSLAQSVERMRPDARARVIRVVAEVAEDEVGERDA